MSTPTPHHTSPGLVVAEPAGAVAALSRFPVKSMQAERLDSAVVGPEGVLGDRAFGVVELASGEVVRGKSPHTGPRLLACRAAFTDEPVAGGPLPPVRIELPDGAVLSSERPGQADEVLSRYLQRPVALVRSASPGSSFVRGRREFLETAELAPMVADDSLLDASPLSVVTTSTLDELTAARPQTVFDHRRFRMNVVVRTPGEGFLENRWRAGVLVLGGTVRLRVATPTPRCVLTTMAQEDLPRDPAVLRTVAQANSLEIAGKKYPCVGVYATVESAGRVGVEDVVSFAAHEQARSLREGLLQEERA